jgi:ATP-dependent Clp protease ATP-binding subunit ClpA
MAAGVKTASTRLDTTKRNTSAQDFEKALCGKIIGQEDAIRGVVETYQLFLANLNPPNRPVSNLLFLGPTGVGKTRVVEAMAEILFGSTNACIKIDCGEFQHSHEIAKLLGSPPGYLGHRETHPILTQEQLNQWHTENLKLTLLLFDEIEKSSDALWQLLLGIMDKAVVTLGDNRRVDLSRCMIFLTSNLGSGDIARLQGEGGLGFTQSNLPLDASLDGKIDKVAVEAARRKFTPEFMNRIDKTIVFKTLREEDLKQILEIELRMIQKRVIIATKPNPFVFVCNREAKEYLLKEGTDSKYGARHLKRILEKNLVLPLANLISTNQIKLGDYVQVELEEGKLIFSKKRDEDALVPTIIKEYGPEMLITERPIAHRTSPLIVNAGQSPSPVSKQSS